MLDLTLATSFAPGTNLKGKLAGNWSFVLPSLELQKLLCFGTPPPGALETLSRLSEHVLVVDKKADSLHQVEGASHDVALANVQALLLNDDGALPLLDNSVDLIWVGGEYDVRKMGKRPALMTEIRRVLKPQGMVYFEYGGLKELGRDDEDVRAFAQQLGQMNRFWVTPMTGEMETAVPASDSQVIDYFIKQGLYSPAVTLPKRVPFIEKTLERTELFMRRNPRLSSYIQRYSTLIGPQEVDLAGMPPHYLRHSAQKAGVDLAPYRWGVLARGLYKSRKVIFFLFEPDRSSPQIVVKMTRGAEFNYRLENEYRGLTFLRSKGVGDPEVVPQPLFLDHHGGLALMGQTVIEGTPFQKHTQRTAYCPHVHKALDWLIELSVKTADTTSVTVQDVSQALYSLFEQFSSVYHLNTAHQHFLRQQIDRLQQAHQPFPLVFQHGDPGTWNVMVTANGRSAFLDWEASEPKGMPLWDLLYFLRSYCVGAARSQGERDALAGFNQHVLQESPLSRLVVDSIDQYVGQVGVPRSLMEPLFYSCWMHRALKQATRLSGQKMEQGHYVNLLRLCIDQRQAPTLRRLFG